jgi:hypothetical protein
MDMGWIVSKLNVDMNTDQVTMEIVSDPTPNRTILLGFRAPETAGPSRAAHMLDNATRKALIDQAKQVLTDAANSVWGSP